MPFKVPFTFILLLFVVFAPVVDATICNDCNDFSSHSEITLQQEGRSAAQLVPDGSASDPQTPNAQDLCPFCSDSAAAMNTAFCGIPTTIGQMNHLPQLLSLPDLSFSIIKPPQN